MTSVLPLDGTTVVDSTRMLPGAIAARMLIDLGARLIKIEDPGVGDPFRHAPPMLEGVGAAFAVLYRGAESVCLDLRQEPGAASLLRLARHADVFLENFRPGTLAAWGVETKRLMDANPTLVICSLSGFGQSGDHASRAGHDLNFTAESGLFSMFPGDAMPRVPFSDVSGGLLGCGSILAALLVRARTGKGCYIDQPLIAAPLPFLSWAIADQAAGGGGLASSLLSGALPAYRVYSCADGRRVALGALEPKFWTAFTEMIGMDGAAGLGLDAGPAGAECARKVAEIMSTLPRDHWIGVASRANVPLSPVADLDEAVYEQRGPIAPYLQRTAAGGRTFVVPGPFVPSIGRRDDRPAPRLGEHTRRVLDEFCAAP
ncbi:MAG: CaiB/BaiF CoA-transferase family protein [Acidobacteriota bacterium]